VDELSEAVNALLKAQGIKRKPRASPVKRMVRGATRTAAHTMSTATNTAAKGVSSATKTARKTLRTASKVAKAALK
jgi:hypothetical protein